MRILFKILLFPISLILTIFVAVSNFLIVRCAILLNIISGIVFLGAILIYLQYFFGWPYGEAGNTHQLIGAIVITILAFLLSPFGLPSLMAWIVGKLDDLNQAIKSI